MLRRLALLLLAFALLHPPYPADAQDTRTSGARTWTADGFLYGSSRSFQTVEERDGTFYYNFQIFEFDTAHRAENGIDPLVDSLLEYMAPLETEARPIMPAAPPTVGDSTLAYEGHVILEAGYTLDAAILVMRHDRYLHAWVALARGFAANPLLDLATIADDFFPDPYAPEPDPPAPGEVTFQPARLIDRVPAITDMPPGFAVTGEMEKGVPIP
jgi:hypothetical protein